jgi:oxidase EvaA
MKTCRPEDLSFIHSALCDTNPLASPKAFKKWFAERKKAHHFKVERIPLREMEKWCFNDAGDLVHRSGRFFRVEGLEVESNYGAVHHYEQPIINQPEIGILGILSRIVDGTRLFLMQAKMEPGNLNTLQLSPTVQATHSNYTQVHGGDLPSYLDYFLDPKRRTLVDQLQSEQTSRFLRKRNRNIILEIDNDIDVADDFSWLTLRQIKELAQQSNCLNMEARSVLSCIPYASMIKAQITAFPGWIETENLSEFSKGLIASFLDREKSRHRLDEILHWLTERKSLYRLENRYGPLGLLNYWKVDDEGIRHREGKFFEFIAVSVEAGNREVKCWQQPLLNTLEEGLSGLLCQLQDGIVHFLMQARVEPGCVDTLELAPTVSCNQGENCLFDGTRPPYIDYFHGDGLGTLIHESRQSAEGGRFYQDQNRYLIVLLPENEKVDVSDDYRWMTLPQILEFGRFNNYVNVETRELIACLPLGIA